MVTHGWRTPHCRPDCISVQYQTGHKSVSLEHEARQYFDSIGNAVHGNLSYMSTSIISDILETALSFYGFNNFMNLDPVQILKSVVTNLPL